MQAVILTLTLKIANHPFCMTFFPDTLAYHNAPSYLFVYKRLTLQKILFRQNLDTWKHGQTISVPPPHRLCYNEKNKPLEHIRAHHNIVSAIAGPSVKLLTMPHIHSCSLTHWYRCSAKIEIYIIRTFAHHVLYQQSICTPYAGSTNQWSTCTSCTPSTSLCTSYTGSTNQWLTCTSCTSVCPSHTDSTRKVLQTVNHHRCQ